MSGCATPLIGMTGAGKQIRPIGGHWPRCLLGVSAAQNAGPGGCHREQAVGAGNAPGVPGVSSS
jgi:hypothetical protein